MKTTKRILFLFSLTVLYLAFGSSPVFSAPLYSGPNGSIADRGEIQEAVKNAADVLVGTVSKVADQAIDKVAEVQGHLNLITDNVLEGVDNVVETAKKAKEIVSNFWNKLSDDVKKALKDLNEVVKPQTNDQSYAPKASEAGSNSNVPNIPNGSTIQEERDNDNKEEKVGSGKSSNVMSKYFDKAIQWYKERMEQRKLRNHAEPPKL